jgi:pyrroline-5-carboxylate reductase
MAALDHTVGFVGAGNLAGALIKGLIGAGRVPADRIVASDPRGERLDELTAQYGIRAALDNRTVVTEADLVLLAVKPQLVAEVLGELAPAWRPGSLLISLAAGMPVVALEHYLPGARVVRAVPNTPVMVLAGATAISPGSRATPADLELARTLFEAVGRVSVLDESQHDAIAALSGSGPAYVMVFIEALAEAGVQVGLPRDTALELVTQTVYGAAKMLLETGATPRALKDMATSPRGVAAAGLDVLETGPLRRALLDTVEAATTRSAELGRQIRHRLRGD